MDDTDIIALCLMDDVESVVVNLVESLLETNTKTETDLGLFDVSQRPNKVRKECFYDVTIPRFNDDLFKKEFRMSRTTFELLSNVVGFELSGGKKSYPDLRKKIMFSVWILAKRETYVAAGDRFGYARSTGHAVFYEIINVMANLSKKYVKWPSRTRSQNEATIFQRRSGGFPGVVGVVGACYIRIKGFNNEYYDKSAKSHSVVLQATCDHKGRFTDIFCGMPGKMDKSTVFKESELYSKLIDTTAPLIPSNMHILGDTSYPLLQNLMTPIKSNDNLTRKQKNYNEKLNMIEYINKKALDMLIGTFGRLEYLDCSTISAAKKIIISSCVLQNFLIDRNEIDVHKDNESRVIKDENMENDLFFNDNIEGSQEPLSALAKRDAIVRLLL